MENKRKIAILDSLKDDTKKEKLLWNEGKTRACVTFTLRRKNER